MTGGGKPALGIETEVVGSGDWHAMSGGVGSKVCKELRSAGGPDSPVANMLKGQILRVSETSLRSLLEVLFFGTTT